MAGYYTKGDSSQRVANGKWTLRTAGTEQIEDTVSEIFLNEDP